MALPVHFFVGGEPKSRQAMSHSRRSWVTTVRSAAVLAWGDQGPDGGQIAVTITYFHLDHDIDLDNMAKPILDALNGVIYGDDSQVTDLLRRKRDMRRQLRLVRPPLELFDYLGSSSPTVHLSLRRANDDEVTSW